MTAPRNGDWHIMLADLSLILFGIASLAATNASQQKPEASSIGAAPVAVYRPPADLAYWLRQQPRDTRASLTITARFTRNEPDAAAASAVRMAEVASRAGFRTRIVIEPAARPDLFATLSYAGRADVRS